MTTCLNKFHDTREIDLSITAKGDLHIDEHHTIEDVAITLGEAFNIALENKRVYGALWFLSTDG